MGPEPRIVLDGAGVLAALGVAAGWSPLDGWRLDRAFPHHEGGALIAFAESEGGRRTVGLQIRLRRDDAPAWRRTRHLDVITHVPADVPEGPLLAALAPLIDRLEAVDGEHTQALDPEAERPPAPPARPLDLPPSWLPEATSPFAFGRVFVLDLDSDCGLDCSFCSTRGKLSPRTTFDPAEEGRLGRALDRAHELGYRVLRVSGLDPLTHPAALGLIARATALGFEHVHVYTPGHRLADDGYRRALLGSLPPAGFHLHIPLYGSHAALHDRVVGRQGSWAEIIGGLDGLRADGALGHVFLLTVVVSETVDDLPALRRLFARYGAPAQVFLPFPATRDPADRFHRVAVRHSDLVASMCACDPPLGLPEILPCVRFRHERDTGQPALSSGGLHPVTALLGTLFQHAEYRRVHDGARGNTFTIPVQRCPHLEDCALARVCPGVVYRAYADRFGLDELEAVGEADLAALGVELP